MSRTVFWAATLLFLFALPPLLFAEQTIQHEITIELQPDDQSLQVEDQITLPEFVFRVQRRKASFKLHGGLNPYSPTAGVEITREEGSGHDEDQVPIEHYTVTLPPGRLDFILNYQGKIDHPLHLTTQQNPRRFDEPPGFIAKEGIHLGATSHWYPWFGDDLVTFSIDVRTPKPWEVISQANRTLHKRDAKWVHARWESPEPQDEILLIGGRFTEYVQEDPNLKAMAFLRTPDKAIAENYLGATFQYLEMYSRLIGPYPYKKFALVENFWETGYGMPSFTLLGPRVIRMPFILHSSYPHEILHNWWGNSVYVDYEAGNWSEGLTSYLADHLIQEQRGTAVEYRRSTLQKYTDYVTNSKDFPLILFGSRNSSVTEAVGYGKTMMFFHMLRLQLGNEAFKGALQEF